MMMREKISTKKRSGGVEIEDHIFSVTETEALRIEMPLEKKKLTLFWLLSVVIVCALFGRVFYLNVVKSEYYKDAAKVNSIRSIVIKAPRGKIIDRNGETLVNNFPSMDAVVIPADLPQEPDKRNAMSKRIGEVLNLNSGEVIAKFEIADQKSLNAILLKDNISQEEALIIEEQKENFPGVMIERTSIRDYVDSVMFSHVIGYEGKIQKKELENNAGYLFTDYIGKQGLEKSYEKYLRGVHGATQVDVDSLGNIKKKRGVIDPKPGSDIILNIDAELQKKMFDSLTAILETTQTKTAAAVAIDPRDGSVRALVSLPSYDNNLFSKKISQEQYLKLIQDPDRPLFNRAVSGEYPPASTIKPLISIAALSEGTINSSTTVNDSNGAINVGSFRFGDWKTHGIVDVKKAIAESCDVFFYAVGGGYANITGLGMDRMKKYANMFGLGLVSGIDLPGEATGLIPSEQWKKDKFNERWYIGNSYHAAIGQGFVETTPLQLVNYIAAIANGGTVYKPHVVDYIKGNDGSIINIKPVVIKENFISPDIMKVVHEGMRQTITEGTAQSLKNLSVEVAGKTGTAEFGTEDKTHASFVSFAPYDKPELAMIVLVEGGGDGYSSAVPVTRDIYDWYFNRK